MSEKFKNSFTIKTNYCSDASISQYSLWPEWKDRDLNNEKWEISKGDPDELFVDSEPIVMPQSLKPDHWIRAKDLKYLTDSPILYITTTEYPDLITNNKHLLHSEFVRWFLSALINLQYCGREGLEISGESSNFAWTGHHNPWYGWMHIYSMNKVGENVQHQPKINPNGKYIVRLHYMGCWRRILVDDIIPINKDGKPLLPCTSNNYELWPMLLAKALLKIASLSWTKYNEIVDFHPVTCLTGWTCLIMNITHLSLQDKWNLLTKYSERFKWTSQDENDYIPESPTNATRKPEDTSQLPVTEETKKPIAMFLLINDMRAQGSDAIPGLSPCRDHVIYIVQSRDIPLDPKNVKPPLAKWKFHRWLNWAVSQNIIDPIEYFAPIRYLKIISSLKKCVDKSDVERNLISSNEIKHSDKFAERETRSQKMSYLSITLKEEATENVSQWIDFNKMASYVTEVHLFYKLESFQCSIQVTDESFITANNNRKAEAESSTTTLKEIRKEKADIHTPISKIFKSRYKPLYLFCDSLEKKFFLINLSATPKKKRRDYLILEKHNWFFTLDQSNQSINISTIGNKSISVELEAGRQLLRMHSRLNSGLITISSDTNFYLTDKETVQQLMTIESKRIEQLSKIISNNLCRAYRSFGTEDYPAILENFYHSYMPDLQLLHSSKKNKSLRTLIHHYFMKEKIQLIHEIILKEKLEDIFHALRVFFLNPCIRSGYVDLITNRNNFQNLMTRRTLHSCEETIDFDEAATMIQSFFKMTLIKGYKQLHNPNHILHGQIREQLLKLSDLFDSSFTNRLLRNVINRHNNLRNLYPCSEDFIHVLNIQEFGETLRNIKHKQWFPIVRLVVNPKPTQTKTLAAFELLIDLPRFALRVFNNQNGHEMTRLVNCVFPNYYEYLPNGYTVFAYGWSDEQYFEKLDWKIRVITKKSDPIFNQLDDQPLSLESKLPRLLVKELIGTYIPNARNYISQWILQTTEKSIVSIRLTTSYKLVEIKIKIADEDGNILIDLNGNSTILLPLIILNKSQDNNNEFKNANKKKKNLYYIEAFILNNSWPLTYDEWMTVNLTKTKSMKDVQDTQIQSENKISSSSDLSTVDVKQFTNDGTLEPPYWILQIVTDMQNTIEIYEDKSREEKIIFLKESWCSKDPNRLECGKNLRKTFLSTYALEVESDIFLNKEKAKLIEDEDTAFCLPHARQYRTLKPPEPYHLFLDLTKYMKKDETVEHRIKTKSNDEILKNQHIAIIIDSQTNYSNYLENLAKIITKQLKKYIKNFEKKKKNFWQRRALVNAVYETRKIYTINSIVEKEKIKK